MRDSGDVGGVCLAVEYKVKVSEFKLQSTRLIYGLYIWLDARGFQDQNARLDPSWLVAAEGSKKKNIINFFFSLRPI